MADKFFNDDVLLHQLVTSHFPEIVEDITDFGWLWVKAQIWKESSFQVDAVSRCGAKGLMQLMPATAFELGCDNPFDPITNLAAGIRYLAMQYRAFSEIPAGKERLRFSLAAYNCGRGYINKALQLAREAEGLPADYQQWQRQGCTPGFWQTWQVASRFLRHPQCQINNKVADWQQVIGYVHYIESKYSQYLQDSDVPRWHEAWAV